MNFLFERIRLLRQGEMVDAVRETIAREERTGAIASNVIRYGFCLLLLALVVSNWHTGVLLTNLVALGSYMTLTVLQTIVIRKVRSRSAQEAFLYLSIVADTLNVAGVLLFYTLQISPDNFSFAVKNSILWYLFLPVVLSAVQFRFRPLFLSIMLSLTVYLAFIGIAFYQGVPVTNDWKEYVMGPAIIPGDFISSRMIVFFAICMVLVYMMYRALRMAQSIGQAQAQKTNLARYFSPDMVAVISENPEKIDHGSRHEVAILFLDIRGFTSLSEKMPPEELVEFLSEFRGRMSSQVFEHNGTLDKYIGDAIMATFGTPSPSPEPGRDARNAFAAARGMLQSLREFNQARLSAGKEEIRIGIGLHVGEVFAGNIRAGKHVEYSVIGDAVNVAARIESLTKKFQAELIVSESFLKYCNPEIAAQKLPKVILRGKSKPIQLYKV